MVLKQLRNYGDTIVHASVSSEQDNKMLAMLAELEPDREYSTNWGWGVWCSANDQEETALKRTHTSGPGETTVRGTPGQFY